MPDDNRPKIKSPEPEASGITPESNTASSPATSKPKPSDDPATVKKSVTEDAPAAIQTAKPVTVKTENPPLSQREQEHLTYLRVLRKYNDAKVKRIHYRRYGTLFILISAFVFLALMFSLSTKILFLCLWIVTVLYCVFLMIRADYRYHCYKEMLGIADESDEYEKELLAAESEEESENDPGKNGGKQ